MVVIGWNNDVSQRISYALQRKALEVSILSNSAVVKAMLVGGSTDIDVIVSDIDTPAGRELLETYPMYAPACKFVAITAASTEEKAIACVGKAVGYFPEPLDSDRIVSVVFQRAERFKRGFWEVDTRLRKGFYRGRPFDLTHYRFLVYAELVKHGRTNYQSLVKEIYNELLNQEDAKLRLKTHVQYLREDLREICGEDVIHRYKQDVFWNTE